MKRKAFFKLAAAAVVCFTLSNALVLNACAKTQSRQNASDAESVKITVGKDDNCDFSSIQEAVDSINYTPTEETRAVIAIYPGEYEEVVNINKPYVTLTNASGSNPEDVVITYDRASSHENPEKKFGTQQSATVTVDKDAVGFIAENITIQNSYNLNQPNLGDDGARAQTQAVALVTLCDKVILKNCHFLGRQDTLYLKGASMGNDVYAKSNQARVYVEKCLIEGTVDYIFGDATAYFYDCDLNMAYYTNGGHYTAANTTLFNIGYVFDSCRLRADEKYKDFKGDEKKNVDLGRPWQGDNTYPNYGSHTVFINCSMPEDILAQNGFSAWNDSTVTNKIRYYEYGSVNEKGEKLDLSKRIGWEKILTQKQAQAYNAFNVLRGDDNWNPANDKFSTAKAADVTLDKYNIEIPEGENAQITAFVLPINAQNKNVKYISKDESIASVDEKSGVITAISQGNTEITAYTEENGFSSSCNVKVLPKRTDPPVVDKITISADGKYEPGTVLTASYSYKNKADNDIDCAKVKWFCVDNEGKSTLVQEGREEFARSYTIKGADIGCILKFVVEPETVTSYGNLGKVSEKSTKKITADSNYKGKTYLRDGFNDFEARSAEKGEQTEDTVWIKSNSQPPNDEIKSFVVVNMDENPTIGGGITDLSKVEYQPKPDEQPWENPSIEARMIFNPTSGGFSSNCYYNILTNYNSEKGSYYKLKIERGSNTNSLKLFLYKNDGSGEDVLLASDEESLKDNVAQNSSEQNPWFRIKQTNKNGKIRVEFKLESQDKPLSVLEAEDESPIDDGFIAFENYGKVSVLLNDFIICEKAE